MVVVVVVRGRRVVVVRRRVVMDVKEDGESFDNGPCKFKCYHLTEKLNDS